MFRSSATLLFRYLLALSIAWAPTMSAFASTRMSAEMNAAEVTAPMHHVDHAGAYVECDTDSATPLAQHAHCHAHCCVACSMSFMQTNTIRVNTEPGHSLQVPLVGALHPDSPATPLLRPPRSLA